MTTLRSNTQIAPATELRFVIPGIPVAKGRARSLPFMKPDGTPGVRPVTPTRTRKYEDAVRELAQLAVNLSRWGWSKADRFHVVLRIVRPHWDAGGDIDNYVKACLDGMNKIVFADDRYVRGLGVAFLEPDPKNPRIEVHVRRFQKGQP